MTDFLQPKIESIPGELKDLCQWVCWKLETRDGKLTKPPYNPSTGSYAESNNPSTWCDFHTAFSEYNKNGHQFAGVGIVLTKDDSLTGFDFDHCIDRETGQPEPWAQKIVDALNTYAEISPSGTGIRGFLRGKLPPGGRKKGNIEFYDSGRYLTVTGHSLNGNQIEDRQAELEKLHSEIFTPKKEVERQLEKLTGFDDLLTKAFNSKNGDKIKRLHGGDWSDHPSQSEADQAFCNHLAFWSNCDFQIIDTVFRGSGLMREKWDKKHFGDGRTYGQATIENAIAITRETCQAKSPVGEQPEPKQNEGGQEKKVLMSRFSPRPLAEDILKRHEVIFDQDKRFMIFDEKSGLWNANAEMLIEADLRQNLLGDELLKKYYIAEIIADVKSLSLTMERFKEPAPDLIPFSNGIYDLKNNLLLSYAPHHFFTGKLAVKYDPGATCPFIDKIFAELVDDPVDLYELIAYCMYRDYLYQKWFFLFGPGGNGKSVFASILEMLLGRLNIKAITPDEFQKNRFAAADLHGKFANLAGEMRYEVLKNTDILKRLVGGDLLRAERKHKDPFYFTNYAKLIFSTNELPKTTDRTVAFYRRLFLIEFPNKFEGTGKEDKLLLRKVTEKELQGLANKCLGYLKGLLARGFFFTNDKSVDELTTQYEKMTNPLVTFLKEHTLEKVDGAVAKWEFKELFEGWLKEKGFRVWNDATIFKEMRQLEYEDGRSTFDGKVNRCWFGFTWREV